MKTGFLHTEIQVLCDKCKEAYSINNIDQSRHEGMKTIHVARHHCKAVGNPNELRRKSL